MGLELFMSMCRGGKKSDCVCVCGGGGGGGGEGGRVGGLVKQAFDKKVQHTPS